MAEILTELDCFGGIEPPMGKRKSGGVSREAVVGSAVARMHVVTEESVITPVGQDHHHQKSPSEFLLVFP